MVKKGFCSRRILLLLAMTGFAAACLFMLPHISKRIQEFEAAPVQMEYLDRGTVAMKTDEGIFLSWRLLGTEDYHSGFSIYRNGRQIAQVKDSTNYTDAAGSESDQYVVVLAEEPYGEGKTVSVWKEACLRIPLDIPRGGISADGEEYNYTANDATCADLDGDAVDDARFEVHVVSREGVGKLGVVVLIDERLRRVESLAGPDGIDGGKLPAVCVALEVEVRAVEAVGLDGNAECGMQNAE